MMTGEKLILVINIILASISGYGAYKSFRYFNKSRHITIYAHTNQALSEIEEMLKKLPNALHAASSVKKGFSAENTVKDIGKELAEHLNVVIAAIPSDYSAEFRELLKPGSFDLTKYINSLIDGKAIVIENGRKTLNRKSFDACIECLREMQEFLKIKISKEEEKLK